MRHLAVPVLLLTAAVPALAGIPATPVMTLYRFNGALNLPYYAPLDKTHFPLPPSGWCTWYYY